MRTGLFGAMMVMAALAVILAGGFFTSVAGGLGLSRVEARSAMVEGGVARFIAEDVDDDSLPPSFALVSKLKETGPPPPEWDVVPEFRSSAKKYSVSVEVGHGVSLYGTGEVAGPLLRNGRVTETWNADRPGYGARHKNLYQSHPWVLAVREDGTAFGVLADTTYRCEIDLRNGIRFTTRGRPFPVYVIDADSPQDVVKKLGDLTGKIELPPLWSLGYHQCRWSYYPDSRVKEIADEFRAREIPCDVIWVDIHYMDGYRVFTFDPEMFPDPKGLNDYLHSLGFKSIYMIDPGVKKDPGYFVYDQGTEGGHWVLDKRGNEFNGSVWPGPCAFPDFTRPETSEWWAGLYRDFMATGVDGVWNDMNDPSIFDTLTRTMPESNLHRGGGDLPPGDHALYHNVYGTLMVKATREGVMRANPDKRPFVLTRSDYIGGQRYAASWTGDNLATWRHLRYSVAMILNLGLSGQPFIGPDVGGFSGKGTPEMFARWFGIGAFFPFSRGHVARGNIDKEPWAFGPEVEESVKTSIERRYRLLPYLYTLFQESSRSGMPVMRPAFFADPSDPDLREEEEAFLVGGDLLVLAQLSKKAGHKHALPDGIWRPFTLVGEDPEDDVTQPEIRIRGGAIIVLGRVIQNTTEKSLDPLTLVVCLDDSGRAEGRLYEDAGEGWEFKDGQYLLTTYQARTTDRGVVVEIKTSEGAMQRPARKVVVELVTEDGVVRGEGSEGRPIVVDTD